MSLAKKKITQTATVFASEHHEHSLDAMFNALYSFVIVQSYCVQSLVGKKVLSGAEKSTEVANYSVPSFGGHIAISDDVTTHPVLVMARTTPFWSPN